MVRLRKALWIVDSWQKEGPILRRWTGLRGQEQHGETWSPPPWFAPFPTRVVQTEWDIGAEFMDPGDYKVSTVALPYDDDGSSEELRIGFIDAEWLHCQYQAKVNEDGRARF